MTRKTIIGVMGVGENATTQEMDYGYQLGKLIAENDWILLTGGRNVGVMEAANQGAKAANGLTVGILPDRTPSNVSSAVDIAIFTDLGNARNNINVLSSDIIIACGMGLGTASEVALALKNGKKAILLAPNSQSQAFFLNLASYRLFIADNPQDAIAIVKREL
ncbi:MAG: cytochrome [Pleurocapsa sp.]